MSIPKYSGKPELSDMYVHVNSGVSKFCLSPNKKINLDVKRSGGKKKKGQSTKLRLIQSSLGKYLEVAFPESL